MKRITMLMIWCLTMSLTSIFAADYYVNNVKGSDDNDGKSVTNAFKTIDKGLAIAGPGDTVHLTKTGTLYRQSANFRKGGEPGKPITLDGHGVTLSGTDPCPATGWKEYKSRVLMRNDISTTVFMLVDRKMVFRRNARDAIAPGEFCFEYKTLYCHPKDKKYFQTVKIEVENGGKRTVLDSKKWGHSHSKIGAVRRYRGIPKPKKIYVDGVETPLIEVRNRLEPGMWTTEDTVYGYPPKSRLYYMPPTGKKIDDLEIECVVRQNGVFMGGKISHVTVKNLNAIHVGNDGYNIHGQVTHAEFYNCNARQCGDEGFSAHDKCETLLDGAVYEECDNAIANVNNEGFSITRNVILAKSRHVGYLIQSRKTAWHKLENAIIVDNPSQLGASDLQADNVLIVKTADTKTRCSGLGGGRNFKIKRITMIGNNSVLRAGNGSNVDIDNAVFWGDQGVLHIRSDEPDKILKFSDVVAGPTLTMEWGAKYPWKKLKIGEWVKKAAEEGFAKKCQIDVKLVGNPAKPEIDLNLIPKDKGCSKELLRKYNAYIQGK